MKKGVITDYSWRKKRILLFIFIILFILMIPTLLMLGFTYRHIDYLDVEDERYPYQNVIKASDLKLNSIERTLSTEDGEMIWTSEIPLDHPKGVIIYLGALKEPSVTCFYGHAAAMQEFGFASFLLEVRSHGASSGKKLGLGYTEIADVRALVNYIRASKEYQNVPIILQGVSLGGVIAINATAQIPEVAGCVAMSPYASVDDQLDFILKKNYIPGFLRAAQRPFTHQSLRWIYGKETADHMTPLEQIQNVGTKPVLVIASSGDEEISVENSYLLQKKSDTAEFWIREGSNHYVIENNDFKNVANDKEYCNYVAGFINKIIRVAHSQ